MGISEKKMKIVIDNYFKAECNINTSIKEAFEKGFRIGVIKGQSVQSMRPKGHWQPLYDGKFVGGAYWYGCSECKHTVAGGLYSQKYFCESCGADMREVTT